MIVRNWYYKDVTTCVCADAQIAQLTERRMTLKEKIPDTFSYNMYF